MTFTDLSIVPVLVKNSESVSALHRKRIAIIDHGTTFVFSTEVIPFDGGKHAHFKVWKAIPKTSEIGKPTRMAELNYYLNESQLAMVAECHDSPRFADYQLVFP